MRYYLDAEFNGFGGPLIARPGYRHPIARITFELCDVPGFEAAAASAVPHNALEDAIALRNIMCARDG